MEDQAAIQGITPLVHFLMLLFVIFVASSISITGRRARRNGYLNKFSMWFGICLFALWIVYNIYNFLPANFRIDESLPLHACDMLAIIASLSLVKANRKTSALLYFCALSLAGQAIITPNGNQDPATFRFWLFWLLHAGIISASIYDLVVRKYRPAFKDFLCAILCLVMYAAVILPVNIAFDWNYGFIGNSKPDVPTVIDTLGPWPLRLLWMFFLVVIVLFIMYLPWKLFNKKK